MIKHVNTILSAASIALTLWLMSFGSLTENSGALSKTGLVHPVIFAIWGIITYSALYINIIYGLKKAEKYNKYYGILSALAGAGMILTLACDFDFDLKVQYYLHCAGSLAFSAITGILVFILFLYQFKNSIAHKIFTIIIAIILITDMILLFIFKETALIEAVPIIFGIVVMTVFNYFIKDKEYATR